MSNIPAPNVEFAKKCEELIKRSAAHGVELKPGEPFIMTIEKLINRLDQYRDKPAAHGRILVQ